MNTSHNNLGIKAQLSPEKRQWDDFPAAFFHG